MAKMVLLNTRIFAGGVDLSGSSNKIEIGEEAEDKDVTNFRSGNAKQVIAGLTSIDISAEGQWEAGDAGLVDDATWAQRRDVGPWSVAPDSDSDLNYGGLIYFTKALRNKSTLWGALGDVAGWSASAVGAWPLVRGMVLHPSGVQRTATGNGTGVQLGAVPAGSKLYAALHVIDATGTTPSFTAKVQSGATNAFSSPTDELSFSAATVEGGQILRTTGSAITNTWFRLNWTITGTTPGFLVFAAIGIER